MPLNPVRCIMFLGPISSMHRWFSANDDLDQGRDRVDSTLYSSTKERLESVVGGFCYVLS